MISLMLIENRLTNNN